MHEEVIRERRIEAHGFPRIGSYRLDTHTEDVTLMRVIWLAVALTTGIGFLAYFAAWILMPSDHGLEPRPMVAPQTQAM